MLQVKINQFEGPLGLLLRLIEKDEMDVTEVSLARVADQFVEYIKKADNIDPEVMADFLVVAAKLLLAKSRALLPYLYPEEEDDIEDLEKQLKMYKEFLEAAKRIDKMLHKKKFMFAREFNRKVVLTNVNSFSPPKKLQKEDMKDVFSALLERLRPVEKMEEKVIDSKVSIDDKILSIQEMVIRRIKISFSRVLKSAKNKTEVVVSFLAALELMRQREVVLTQESMFGEIYIRKS